jgi:hypothetical protein
MGIVTDMLEHRYPTFEHLRWLLLAIAGPGVLLVVVNSAAIAQSPHRQAARTPGESGGFRQRFGS